MKKKISILIPAYNNDLLLLRLIKSLELQTCIGLCEVVISDDCSPNPYPLTIKHLEESELHYKWFRQEKNLGVLKNAMFLVDQAACDYVVFSQHDDYYIENDFFESAIKILDKGAGFVFANACFEDSNQKMFSPVSSEKFDLISSNKFSELFWHKLMTSWSSLVFNNSLLCKICSFGSEEYTLDTKEANELNAYDNEEGMAFLYIICAVTPEVCVYNTTVSVRGLPEDKFSTSLLNPSRNYSNDSLFFIYLKAVKLIKNIKNTDYSIKPILRMVRIFGLKDVNEYVNRFLKYYGSDLLVRNGSYIAFESEIRHRINILKRFLVRVGRVPQYLKKVALRALSNV